MRLINLHQLFIFIETDMLYFGLHASIDLSSCFDSSIAGHTLDRHAFVIKRYGHHRPINQARDGYGRPLTVAVLAGTAEKPSSNSLSEATSSELDSTAASSWQSGRGPRQARHTVWTKLLSRFCPLRVLMEILSGRKRPALFSITKSKYPILFFES